MGDYNKKWRIEKELLIRVLAEKLGVTEDSVINWEAREVKKGRAIPDPAFDSRKLNIASLHKLSS